MDPEDDRRLHLIVDGDVIADISLLEDRARFLAVMQGGAIRAGRLATSGAGQE